MSCVYRRECTQAPEGGSLPVIRLTSACDRPAGPTGSAAAAPFCPSLAPPCVFQGNIPLSCAKGFGAAGLDTLSWPSYPQLPQLHYHAYMGGCWATENQVGGVVPAQQLDHQSSAGGSHQPAAASARWQRQRGRRHPPWQLLQRGLTPSSRCPPPGEWLPSGPATAAGRSAPSA